MDSGASTSTGADYVHEPNGIYSTAFDIKHDDFLAGIKNGEIVNREVVTASAADGPSFDAKTEVVQYGKHDGDDAVLVVIGLHFNGKLGNKRFTRAIVKVIFEATANAKLESPKPRRIANDPTIRYFGPIQWYGETTATDTPIVWEAKPEVQLDLGVGSGTLSLGSVSGVHHHQRDYSLKIHGNSFSPGAKHPSPNGVQWTINEDECKKDEGIPYYLKTAIVATLPADPKHPVKIRVEIKPYIASLLGFMLNPRSKDDPIYLDRQTNKPMSPKFGHGAIDFADSEFPWDEVDVRPRAGENLLFLTTPQRNRPNIAE